MYEITQITPQIKDKRRCNIYLDGRFYCGLTMEAAIKYRLKVGVQVNPKTLSEIQLESEKNTALDKALTHISASQKTEREIKEFLTKKGYLSAVIEYVLEKMRSYGFVDDRAYAAAYAENAVKRKGKKLIELELKRKGINGEAIDQATENLQGEEDTAKRIAEKYMRGKTPDRANLQKTFRYLLSKGFVYDTAKSALSALGDTEEE